MYSWKMGTEMVVSQWCCGEGEGHALGEPEGKILKLLWRPQLQMALRSTTSWIGACNLTFVILR